MKYIIISPETGEHIASISKDALQLASILTNEHLFDMLRDHTEQRLTDHVQHLNAELAAVVAGINRDEISNFSIQQLSADQVPPDPDRIYKLEIVPNDSFEPSERVSVCTYDLKLFVRCVDARLSRTFRAMSKIDNEYERRPYQNEIDLLKKFRSIFTQYLQHMHYAPG